MFAPRVESESEDDGYLIAYVDNLEEAEVWIWKGQKISDGTIARVQLPLIVLARSQLAGAVANTFGPPKRDVGGCLISFRFS